MLPSAAKSVEQEFILEWLEGRKQWQQQQQQPLSNPLPWNSRSPQPNNDKEEEEEEILLGQHIQYISKDSAGIGWLSCCEILWKWDLCWECHYQEAIVVVVNATKGVANWDLETAEVKAVVKCSKCCDGDFGSTWITDMTAGACGGWPLNLFITEQCNTFLAAQEHPFWLITIVVILMSLLWLLLLLFWLLLLMLVVASTRSIVGSLS